MFKNFVLFMCYFFSKKNINCNIIVSNGFIYHTNGIAMNIVCVSVKCRSILDFKICTVSGGTNNEAKKSTREQSATSLD